MPIREWRETTRPRERLVARGPSSLSDDELLALLIGSGKPGRSALLIANEILRALGGAPSVRRTSHVCGTPVWAPPQRFASPLRASSGGV